jgi:dephospho-CoA kinase
MARAVVLTGGIGSGKSAVASVLATWGAHVVDADQLAREVVARGTAGLAAVVAEFGAGVLTEIGDLDRPALADIVFGRPERLAALEAIVHPQVQSLAVQRLADYGDAPVIVYEVPLPETTPAFPNEALADSGPVIVVVDASGEVRTQRLLDRGMSIEQVRARMDAQPPRDEWLSKADVVIDNGADWPATCDQVSRLWQALTGTAPPVGGPG